MNIDLFLLLRKFSINYDASFTQSTFTNAATPSPTSAIKYKVANAYVPLSGNMELTSSLILDVGSNVLHDDSKYKTLSKSARRTGSSLSMSDEITNLATPYLALFRNSSSEIELILSLVCTLDQISNIEDAHPSGKSQCSASQRNDISHANCACCMLDDTYVYLSSLGPAPSYTKCSVFLNDEGDAISMMSLLAYYDHGVAIKQSGAPKFDSSGNNFSATKYGQTSIYSALLQSHTVNDLMFGYPSATEAYFKISRLMEWYWKDHSSISRSSIAKRLLQGELDLELPESDKLGNVAVYTGEVKAVGGHIGDTHIV